jgi:hypothetical protein
MKQTRNPGPSPADELYFESLLIFIVSVPDPDIFVIVLQDGNKKFILKKKIILLITF